MPSLTPSPPALIAGPSEHTALVCGDTRWSYGELGERVERVAHGLARGGLAPGDPVALLLPNGPDFAVGLLAALRLGAVAVPLNPQFKRPEIAFHLHDSGAQAVIADARLAGLCRGLGPRVITSLDEAADGHAGRPAEPDDDAVLQYSSGSTGRPKRVPRTHAQLWWEADAFAAATGLSSADTLLCAIPMFHTYGMGCCLLAALRSGARLVILDAPHPFAIKRGRALQTLEREQVTVFPAVPFMFRLLAEGRATADLSSIRLCLSAASALPRSTFDAFDRRFSVPIRQLYGLTETGAVTVNAGDDPWATAGTVGRPLPEIEVDVLDGAGGVLETGRIGEIAVRSPGMTRGHDDGFLTGDRGRLDEDGRLVITGRRKLLIDVRGDKVDPIEVEDVLAVHPRVREVVVVGVAGPADGEEQVKAVVVPEERCGERELIRFCQERLANFKVPRQVEFRDEIPKSPLGKVLRKYLV